MIIAIAKIKARIEVVAGTYASLTKWAKSVDLVPAETSEDIADFYSLPGAQYSAAITAGLNVVVAEYNGLMTALELIEGEGN